MAKAENQKIKIMKVYDILKSFSDEDRPLTTNEIIDKLKEEGIECQRKSLYDDIDTLNKYGYEIECVRKKQNEYYVVDRNFDIAELKILVDAVEASSFITMKKSNQLINKISRLAGSYRGDVLTKSVAYQTSIKKDNEKIYYSVDAIERAIDTGKKITFKYFNCNINGEIVYRRNGEEYLINPVKLLICDNQYYLICYDDRHAKLASYRVDRMESVTVTNEPRSDRECEKDENVKSYTEGLFQMFSGDEKVKIDLKVVNEPNMVDIIFDKFGRKVTITKAKDDYFYIRAEIATSPTFYAWLTTFSGKIQIDYPKKIREEYAEFLNKNLSATEK